MDQGEAAGHARCVYTIHQNHMAMPCEKKPLTSRAGTSVVAWSFSGSASRLRCFCICSVPRRGAAGPDQLHGSTCSLCILLQEGILLIIYHHMPRERRCLRHSHSNDIYLPNSSLIGDPDAVAWLRAARCTAAGRHRASQAAIASTASLHQTPPFQAAKSKAFLILSGRGAAVALVAARRPAETVLARAPMSLDL